MTNTTYELQWRRGDGWSIWHAYDHRWNLDDIREHAGNVAEENPVHHFRLLKREVTTVESLV